MATEPAYTFQKQKLTAKIPCTKQCSVVISIVSYSGDPGFKSQSRKFLSLLRVFMIFLSPSREILGQYLKTDCAHFFLNSFQFRMNGKWATKSVSKMLVTPKNTVSPNFPYSFHIHNDGRSVQVWSVPQLPGRGFSGSGRRAIELV
jgi:hypothetical protein